MKLRNYKLLFACFTLLLAASCNNDKKSKTETTKDQPGESNKDKPVASNNTIDLQAPNFSDPELKKFYADYTDYLGRVVTSIRNKDEAGTIALFNAEGKKYNKLNEMEAKAKAADEQKFTAWLLSAVPYQTEIVKSEYYKKFNEEYYKKVKEDFEKKKN